LRDSPYYTLTIQPGISTMPLNATGK